MNLIKILLVEDATDQHAIFQSSVEVFNNKNKGNLTLEYEIATSFDEGKKNINSYFDGVILDLKLENDDEAGNKIVELINESLIRVPVIFVTGYPDLINDHPVIIRKRSRDSATYESDFELLKDFKNTGLTHIMGGRGEIERKLYEVFLNNLLHEKNLEKWISYGKNDSSKTERALLRHTLNHLLQLLDNDEDKFYPEEAYIYPPLDNRLRTGSIVKRKDGGGHYVVLNPICDLVIRQNGKCNTDQILLVEIDSQSSLFSWIYTKKPSTNQLGDIKNAYKNNKAIYHHWLPQTSFFDGGFVNFRKLITVNDQVFSEGFGIPIYQISPSFTKDIVARFSSFYSRQGQPEIEYDEIIESYSSTSEE